MRPHATCHIPSYHLWAAAWVPALGSSCRIWANWGGHALALQMAPEEPQATELRRSPRKKAGALRWADEPEHDMHQGEVYMEPECPPGLPLPVHVERGSSKREQRPSAGLSSTDAVRCTPTCMQTCSRSSVQLSFSSASCSYLYLPWPLQSSALIFEFAVLIHSCCNRHPVDKIVSRPHGHDVAALAPKRRCAPQSSALCEDSGQAVCKKRLLVDDRHLKNAGVAGSPVLSVEHSMTLFCLPHL